MGRRKTIEYAKTVSVQEEFSYVVEVHPRSTIDANEDMKREMAQWCNTNVGELMQDWRPSLGGRAHGLIPSRMNPGFHVWGGSWYRIVRYMFKDEKHALMFKLTWSDYEYHSVAEESF